MNSAKLSRNSGGFTLIEMLVVIGIIALLAALLLPALSGGKLRAKRIVCETQLQQIGIGFQSFSHDHNSRFPMQVATNDGGGLEFVQMAAFVTANNNFDWRLFQALGSSLATPNILICPSDNRLPAASYNVLQSSNISYFIGLNAEYDQPLSVLAGDGNLVPATPLLRLAAGTRLTWDHNVHQYKGNVLFSDGHVDEWKDGVNTVGSDSDLLAPPPATGIGGGTGGGGGTGTGGGGGNGSGGGNGGGNGGSQSGPSGGSGSGSSGQSTPPTSVNGSHPSPSPRIGMANPGTNSPNSGPSYSSRSVPNSQGGGRGMGETMPLPIDTTTASEPLVVSNPPAQVSPTNDDVIMSASDQKFTRVVHRVFGTSYILLLLALLAYLIYRIRRWVDERERKRRSPRRR